MPRVLVTGGSGLFGHRTVPLLVAQGWDVVTAARHAGDHRVDITRPGSLTDLVESSAPDAVVHFAGGVAGPDQSTWELNLMPSVELLQASVRRVRPPRVILIGSAAEYGAAAGHVTEETPARPVSDYGRAKYLQTAWARRFHETGAEVLVLRPFNVVAPDLPPSNALGHLRAQVMAGRAAESCTVRCGRLDVVRDFVTAEFVAEVVTRCVDNWPKTPVLNVASGVGIPLGQVFDAVGSELGLRLEYRADPELVAIPAPGTLTADPAALEEATGLRFRTDARALARHLIGAEPPHPLAEPS